MDFKQKYFDYVKDIDEALEGFCFVPECPQKKIFESMKYSVLSGGKRIRAILLLEFCRMAGGNAKLAMPFACAMEIIHAYSLVHDDLPCMDDDDLRRGKPTNHKVYGEAVATLAGDALLNRAFEIMLNPENLKAFSPDTVLSAAYAIARAAGSLGMVGGQVIDIESEGKDLSLNALTNMQLLKTGALIAAACKAGAILGKATQEQINKTEVFAYNLGLAFQIRDDMLDIEGNEEDLGKPIGSDAGNQKTTYPLLVGMDKCRSLVSDLTNVAKDALSDFEENKFLLWLSEYLMDRNK